MRIAIDFDGTIVTQDHPYEDVSTPLKFMPGAKEGLLALKRAGHNLILWSARSNKHLLFSPDWDPAVRNGTKFVNQDTWQSNKDLHWKRYYQMLDFVKKKLPGIFDAVDDGQMGKPNVDLFIDDRAIRLGNSLNGLSWAEISDMYGHHMELPDVREGMPYKEVAEILQVQAMSSTNVALKVIGQTKVGPIFRLDSPVQFGKILVITCAQHGEEQAGTMAICKYANEIFSKASELGVTLTVFPCVNPEGFDSIERYNHSNERPVNSFLQFKWGERWVGEVPNEYGNVETRDYPENKLSKENKILRKELEPMTDKICGILDIHGDGMVAKGGAFAYVFGPWSEASKIMQNSSAVPMANTQLENDSWTEVHISSRTDQDGLVKMYDGSVTDWLYRRGANLSICLETSVKEGDTDAIEIAYKWIIGMIDWAAKNKW